MQIQSKRFWKKFISNVSRRYFKKFFTDNLEKTGLYGYLFDLSIDYDSTDVDNILNIHEYLMEKHNIKWCLGLLKEVYCIINYQS